MTLACCHQATWIYHSFDERDDDLNHHQSRREANERMLVCRQQGISIGHWVDGRVADCWILLLCCLGVHEVELASLGKAKQSDYCVVSRLRDDSMKTVEASETTPFSPFQVTQIAHLADGKVDDSLLLLIHAEIEMIPVYQLPVTLTARCVGATVAG